MADAPFLLSSFFQDHPPSSELIARAPQGPWGPECFPVYEWEGIWYVASAQEESIDLPPEGFMLLRAEPQALAEAWQNLQQLESSADDAQASEIPAKPLTPPPSISSPAWFKTELIPQAREILDGLRTSFDRAMILGFRDDQVTPCLWTEGFTNSGAITPYMVQEPSPFKLVSHTLLPYHGFIMENETTTSFFKDWAGGKMPENITIVPIMFGTDLGGMLLCSGPKSTYTRPHLVMVEEAADKVIELMSLERTAA